MIAAGKFRHRARIMAPPSGLDERGQPSGAPSVVAESIPCGIRPVGGREDEVARMRVPTATMVVDLWGGPKVTAQNWLEIGPRKLFVGYIEDVDQNGIHIRLTCTEEPQ